LAEHYQRTGNIEKALNYYRQYDELLTKHYRKNNSAKILQQKVRDDYNKLNNLIKIEKLEKRIYIGIVVFLLILLIITYIFKVKLNKSYKQLVEKTLKLIGNNELKSLPEVKLQAAHKAEDIQRSISAEDTKAVDSYSENEDNTIENILSDDIVNLALKIQQTLQDNPIISKVTFSIEDLAQLLNSNRDYISKAINGYFKVPFPIYINDLRVIAAIKLMRSTPGNTYTMEYFMEKVGFNNRATFSKSFKRYTGLTPAVFYKTLRQDEAK